MGGGILGIVSYSDSFAVPLVCLTTLYASFATVSGSLSYTQKIVVYHKKFKRYIIILTYMMVLLESWIIPMSY